MTAGAWEVRWERGPEGPYRVGTAGPGPVTGEVPAGPTPEILFLLGRGDSLELRADVARRLSSDGCVIAVEHVGQGASPGLGRRPDAVHVASFDTHVAAALAEVDRLEGPAVLLGHSMGGLVGMHVLAARPRRFTAAVLTSPMWGWAGGLPVRLTELLATLAVRAGRSADLAPGERPFSTAACLDMRGAADDQAARLVHLAQQHPQVVRGGSTWGWVAAASRAMRQLQRLPLSGVRSEVTVVSCANDATVSLPAHARLAGRLPAARVVQVSAGHDPFVADGPARSILWREIRHALQAPSPPEAQVADR